MSSRGDYDYSGRGSDGRKSRSRSRPRHGSKSDSRERKKDYRGRGRSEEKNGYSGRDSAKYDRHRDVSSKGRGTRRRRYRSRYDSRQRRGGRSRRYRRSYSPSRSRSYSSSYSRRGDRKGRSRSRDRRHDSYDDRKRKRKHKKRHKKKAHKASDSGGSSGQHDDTVGHYEGQPGEWLNKNFKVLREAGVGTFGRVLECWDQAHERIVALKIVRRISKYTESAQIEADLLEDVARADPDNISLCVRLYDRFQAQGHMCLAFERLGMSLYDYSKKQDYKPYPLSSVREMAVQLIHAVGFMHSIKLIHTDLKPENILLVNDIPYPVYGDNDKALEERGVLSRQRRRDKGPDGFEFIDISSGRSVCHPPTSNDIKLIDFGGATYDDAYKTTIVNTRQYRAPEVILGLGWSYPSDMWSIGCIIAELYTGELLFATHENLEHLALMEKCRGKIPQEMVARASEDAADYFRNGSLRWPMNARSGESIRHVQKMKLLDEIIHKEDAASGLVDLLEKLLTIDPEKRITAKEAVQHPFFDRVRHILPTKQ